MSLIWLGVGISLAMCCSLEAATYTAMVMNAQTGAPLVQHHANTLVYPASLTKLMTLYLACEALTKGRITTGTHLRISRLAAGQPPCKWGLVPGQKMDVMTAMKILATRSANDIAVALAETLAPSVGQFVQRMNQTAQHLGMQQTHFVNPSGWHHTNQKSTAHDLALLLRALYRRFPQYIYLLGLSGVVKNGQWKRNTNALLGKVQGMVAGKTGYTIPAGWNLATLTQRHGMTLIIVVMGMPQKDARDRHVAQLTDAAFALCQLAQAPQGLRSSTKARVMMARPAGRLRVGQRSIMRSPRLANKQAVPSSRRVSWQAARPKQRLKTPIAKRKKKMASGRQRA